MEHLWDNLLDSWSHGSALRREADSEGRIWGRLKHSVIEAKGVGESNHRKNRVRAKEGLEQNPNGAYKGEWPEGKSKTQGL